mmetsp:Transcript_38475/g.106009  ORF Transcript_38475/g.106009 Transcript_38475/m.106009 type:complete len:245 (+) Transcript_38475:299-1033(+)
MFLRPQVVDAIPRPNAAVLVSALAVAATGLTMSSETMLRMESSPGSRRTDDRVISWNAALSVPRLRGVDWPEALATGEARPWSLAERQDAALLSGSRCEVAAPSCSDAGAPTADRAGDLVHDAAGDAAADAAAADAADEVARPLVAPNADGAGAGAAASSAGNATCAVGCSWRSRPSTTRGVNAVIAAAASSVPPWTEPPPPPRRNSARWSSSRKSGALSPSNVAATGAASPFWTCAASPFGAT